MAQPPAPARRLTAHLCIANSSTFTSRDFNTAITGSGCTGVGFTTSRSGAGVTVTDTPLGAATFSATSNSSDFSVERCKRGIQRVVHLLRVSANLHRHLCNQLQHGDLGEQP